MRFIKPIIRPLLCSLALLAGTAQAADNFPTQPIRMIVGFPPGGISDVVARAVANEAGKLLEQSIIIENRPGAGTTIASDVVARSKPDGYTLLFQDLTTHAINASLYTRLQFDTLEDFTPIALSSSTPLLLVVNSESPATTVAELNQRIKDNPDKFFFGSSGNGTIIHLASEMMNEAVDTQIEHIPYKGSAALVTSLISGDIEYAFSSMPPALNQVQAGKLRPLAVTTPERVSALPDVPTIREAGVPQAELTLYSGVLAPAGVPDDIRDKLNRAFSKAIESPAIIKTFEAMGAVPLAATPAEIRELLETEIPKYGEVIRATGISIN